MADKTYGTLVTDCGIQLIAAAVMEGKKINITDLAVGDGGGSYYKPNSTMTALKGEKWRGKVNRVEVNEKSPNMIDVVAVIPSDVGGWTIREMGVLDETETLIAVCNTPDTEKVIISSGAAGEIELTMHIEISNADAISFIIDPNVVTATKKDIADHDASKRAHAAEFKKKADVTDLNAHANNTDIHVNPSTMGNYDTAISGLIEHKEDTKIHVTAEEKASWTEGAEQAAADANRVTEALNAIAGIESRVSRVEDGLFNNITGTRFLRPLIPSTASRLLRVSGTKKESASNVDGICLPAAGTVLHRRKPVRRTGTTLRPLRRRGQPDDMRNDIRRDTGNADRHRIRIYL